MDDLKIGDRVVVKSTIISDLNNKKGEIIEDRPKYHYAIQFDNPLNIGHSCKGKGKSYVPKKYCIKEDLDNDYNILISSKWIYHKSVNPYHDKGSSKIEMVEQGYGPFIKITQDGKFLSFDLEELEIILREAKEMIDNYNKDIQEE
jgi:hypothetical protein